MSDELNRRNFIDQKGHPDAEANALLGREYRKGYELPKVEPA